MTLLSCNPRCVTKQPLYATAPKFFPLKTPQTSQILPLSALVKVVSFTAKCLRRYFLSNLQSDKMLVIVFWMYHSSVHNVVNRCIFFFISIELHTSDKAILGDKCLEASNNVNNCNMSKKCVGSGWLYQRIYCKTNIIFYLHCYVILNQ